MNEMFARILKKVLRRYLQAHPAYRRLQQAADDGKMLAARPLIERMKERKAGAPLEAFEFKVFSQFGDDGIIQYLAHHSGNKCRRFIEIGVGNYYECNTRFLLLNDNWEGLVIDGTRDDIDDLKRSPVYWLRSLNAVCSFIDCDNVNMLLQEHGFIGDIGLLSIDIDGNDYWVWNNIRVIDPVIVVVEYNATFGPDLAVSVPYNPSFYRYEAHYSGLFWGASLQALCLVGAQKGYAFVGCNSAGNNAYFLRRDHLGDVKEVSPETGFRPATWRDSRDKAGRLDFQSPSGRIRLVQDLEVFDVRNNRLASLRKLGLTAASI